MKILYNSAEVCEAIHDVFAGPSKDAERIALVAYVGAEAEAFLPDPHGLKIVCCLQPGATDPQVLIRLRDRGAVIYKSDRLHMKVYWARAKGCVITSANASQAAMGASSQKEAGVLLSAEQVDVRKLWDYAAPEPIEDKDLRELESRADREPGGSSKQNLEPALSFRAWRLHQLKGWKLAGWDGDASFADEAMQKAKQTFGVESPYDFVNCARGQFKLHDWALSFDCSNGTQLSWLYIDFVVKLSESYPEYEEDFPYQAVQARKPKNCARPPFKIDPPLVKAFKRALKQYGADKIGEEFSSAPTEDFLDLIEKQLPSTE